MQTPGPRGRSRHRTAGAPARSVPRTIHRRPSWPTPRTDTGPVLTGRPFA
ncbi:hypothetical protein GJR88_00416 [Dietzia sp. DQ12-45-1b]|nr:hypothetical protein GJR88_00416 [Dietzia sp. DQ12-45-1b]